MPRLKTKVDIQKKIKVGIFGYAPDYPGLSEVCSCENYSVWSFDHRHLVSTCSAIRGDVPDVMVINPSYASLVEPYLPFLPQTTIIVSLASPFVDGRVCLD